MYKPSFVFLLLRKQTARLVPPSLSRHMKPQQWVERVQYFYQKTAVKLSQSEAKHKYFGKYVYSYSYTAQT